MPEVRAGMPNESDMGREFPSEEGGGNAEGRAADSSRGVAARGGFQIEKKEI